MLVEESLTSHEDADVKDDSRDPEGRSLHKTDCAGNKRRSGQPHRHQGEDEHSVVPAWMEFLRFRLFRLIAEL